ncbi:MAG: DUF3482 domain-containing protein [Burkholderiales bacterium]
MPGVTVTLSLISHTNAGKTTLARTLLARDVGEVRDAPHVTTEASSYTLIETNNGDRLALWDTPGFGDSARLARRLAQHGNPIGWFLAQVWDRWRDRPFWLTQLAVRHVRDDADVILYLVNAAEDPADAGYLAPELAVLAWVGKPVLVLLNQTGPPRLAAEEAAELARWRSAVAACPHVRGVLAFDAFARCWVQEFALFAAIAPLLASAHIVAFTRLADAWRAQRWRAFDEAMAALAQPVAAAVCARVVVPRTPALKKLGAALGIAADADGDAARRAFEQMAAAADQDLRDAMAKLIAIHGLAGRAAGEVEARMAEDVAREGPVGEGKAAAMGGIVSGAVSGLAADLATGGLTFGAGMVTGALLGALGGAGVARAWNVARGQSDDAVRWDDAFLERLVVTSLLRYLAVAHYGRGRGDYRDGEYPAFWRPRVESAVTARRAAFAQVWARRGPGCEPAAAAAALEPLLGEAARAVLAELYPAALAAGA